MGKSDRTRLARDADREHDKVQIYPTPLYRSRPSLHEVKVRKFFVQRLKDKLKLLISGKGLEIYSLNVSPADTQRRRLGCVTFTVTQRLNCTQKYNSKRLNAYSVFSRYDFGALDRTKIRRDGKYFANSVWNS